jgi:hypothetical protein
MTVKHGLKTAAMTNEFNRIMPILAENLFRRLAHKDFLSGRGYPQPIGRICPQSALLWKNIFAYSILSPPML